MTRALPADICSVNARDYLLRRINGIEAPLATWAKEAKGELVSVAADMIAQLRCVNFETLMDLIFADRLAAGVTGRRHPEVHRPVVQQPMTGELAFVQVKSKASQAVLDDYVERFRASGVYDRMFFVCHSPGRALAKPGDEVIHVLAGASLAGMAINAGLLDWLSERVA